MLYPLNDRCAFLTRDLPTGQVIDVAPLTFGRARLLLVASRTDYTVLDEW